MSKTIIVTGACSAYGRAIIHTLADKGHGVVAVMDSVNETNMTAANDLKQTHNVELIEIDLKNNESVKSGFAFILGRYGHVDVLVNNECAVSMGFDENMTAECCQDVFNSNVCGPLRTYKALLPTMKKNNNGLLINVNSGIGHFAVPYVTALSIANAGLEILTESILREVRRFGIECVNLWTGFYPLEFTKGIEKIQGEIGERQRSGEETALASGILKSNANVKEHAQTVARLISELVGMPSGTRPSRYCLNPKLKKAEIQYIKASKLSAEGWAETYGLGV